MYLQSFIIGVFMRKKLFFEFIGTRIKYYREKNGLTIDELASKSGLRKQYIEKIESGRAYALTTTKFFRIAEALKIATGMLVYGWEEFENNSNK